jgi:hypothetical protein
MKTIRSILAVGTALAASLGSQAAFLSIDDSSPDETITLSINDFEGGFTVNGTLLQIGIGGPGVNVTFPEAAAINFSGSWIDNGLTPTGERAIWLLEPTGETSDILTIAFSSAAGFGTISGSFISDSEGSALPAPPPGADIILEDGGFVDFSLPFLTAQFRSDTETVTTPDSGSMLSLLGLAVGAIGLTGRKLRR